MLHLIIEHLGQRRGVDLRHENIWTGKRTRLAFFILLIMAVSFEASAADCIVKAHSTARLGAASKGVISAIHVERGDRVTAGQVLGELESSDEEHRKALAELRAANDAPILAARNRAEAADARLKRLTRLNDKKIATQAELEVAQLEALTAQLDEKQAELDREIARQEARSASSSVERKMVRAPFDGVVVERILSRGELYNEQEPIVVVARIDPLHVETFLPLSLYPRLKLGDKLHIDLETGDDAEGIVTVIDPVLDAATGTFGVRLEVSNPYWKILAGQRCTIAL